MFERENTGLIPVKEEHIEYFLKWFNDPKITQYLSMFLPVGEAMEKEWVRKLYSESIATNIVFVVVALDGDDGPTPIGTVGLHHINWKDRDAEVGIAIGDSLFWGCGHGPRAFGMMIDYAFVTLNLHRLHARAYAFNERSLKMQRRAGFIEEGRFREAVFKNGHYHDVISNGLLRREWEENKK